MKIFKFLFSGKVDGGSQTWKFFKVKTSIGPNPQQLLIIKYEIYMTL